MTEQWWEAIEPQVILERCHFTGARSAKETGQLEAIEAGIRYTGATKVSVRWPDVAGFQLLESTAPKGKKRSAVGFGPLGVAVVGATMLSNRRAGKPVTRRFVRLTATNGRTGEFDAVGDTDLLVARAIALRFTHFTPPPVNDETPPSS